MAERLRESLANRGRAIDAYFYRSPLVYQRELDHLVLRSWIYACHVSEIPRPGDYQLVALGEDSIIISRDDEGGIHALMNICRHRGARLCQERSGNRSTFVCPYHGWVYARNGDLRAARHMEMKTGFDKADYGLRRARCVVYQGLVFVNCDASAGDFLGPLRKLERQLGAYDLASARVAHRQTYPIDANWKLVLENYLECYHCATSHRAYARMHTLKDLDCNTRERVRAMRERSERVTGVEGMAEEYRAIYGDAESFGACVQASRYALYDGYLTGSEDGQPVAPLMGKIKGYDGGCGDHQLGPLGFMLNYPDYCVLYRFLPRGLTRTDMELVWLVNGDAEEGVDYDRDSLTWLWHRTTLEDEYIISRNSEGVNSRFFIPGPYHPEFEYTLQLFIDWYLKCMQDSLFPSCTRDPNPRTPHE
ncbi:aromatic ring-hydroxylating dioxygenase subunit alpha [Seongchinamella sediminis]|uniref:Aromatic ring-hydroxylating dioxygenase subunit alpha n=2 Tax=Seongchinamella sediminis TaxID=2283635 RepID=A0A3L7DWL8_9GAMM|nr:aromatic ring-hydroxylating dioxygenase subunit alpha [Seongchinamella sediminis]